MIRSVVDRLAMLRTVLRECESVVIGYSGGVDSVFLAAVAVETLGPRHVLAVTGRSASLPVWADRMARRVANEFEIPWLEVDTAELENPRYAVNAPDRCYHCKAELWDTLFDVAELHGLRTILDGSNADDVGDYRPGLRAARERGVRSPLMEAGMTKADVRECSRQMGLPTWDQPASPCLSSRLPYGVAVTPERLSQVEQGELLLRGMGIDTVRLRHHDPVARIEVAPADRERVLEHRDELVRRLREIGFTAIVLDISGYRRGALNEGVVASTLVQIGQEAIGAGATG